jgi:hypothetical protein
MDYWLGSIIEDYSLYRIIEGLIAIFTLVAVYLGIQIALTWRLLKKDETSSEELVSQRASFNRSTIFIFIAGFFMLVHEFFEGFEKESLDYVSYELLEMIALLGLVMFFYEWHKMMKKYKSIHK